ncbi:MAG: efflux RND transporter periplasmic adaptor subunit [Bacteroidales bacterium]
MKYSYILLAIIALSACQSAPVAESPAIEPVNPAVMKQAEKSLSQTAEAESTDGITGATNVANHTSFNGTLIVPPQRHATVALTMGGAIEALHLLPGQAVRKGAVLVTIKNPDFIDLQQTYLESHAQAQYLKAEYERQERLSAAEAASQKRFQQSKADYLSMKSRVDAASAQLVILGVNPASLLTDGIQPYLIVKAPFDGYVAAVNVNTGSFVNQGDEICDVINKGESMLRLTAYEKDLDGLKEGKPVQFKVNGMRDEIFEAVVVSVGQVVDDQNRSLEIYARVKNNNPRFRPGMYVTARIEK